MGYFVEIGGESYQLRCTMYTWEYIDDHYEEGFLQLLDNIQSGKKIAKAIRILTEAMINTQLMHDGKQEVDLRPALMDMPMSKLMEIRVAVEAAVKVGMRSNAQVETDEEDGYIEEARKNAETGAKSSV